jgi:hypothetical protein
LHNDKRGSPGAPSAGEQHPEHPIACAETRARGALEHPQLLPEGHVLNHEVVMSTARHDDPAYDQKD